MTQPRLAGALKRAPILPERHPGWTAPRLLRKAEPTARQAVALPQATPVPPPPRDHTSFAGDSIRGAPERRHASVAGLASPAAPHRAPPSLARPSAPRPAARAGLAPVLSLLMIGAVGVATGAGAAGAIVLMSPSMAERVTGEIDTALSALGSIRFASLTDDTQRHGSSLTIALPAASGDGELETLLQRAQGELAERKLEEPPGDNALDSYRRLKAKWPEEKRVAQLGSAIGLAFWSLGNAAQSAGDWSKALHDLEIVNSLPPLPLGSPVSAVAESAAR
jgi:hypothetical protein